jgi:D-amino-acid dehydrogenase
MKSPTSFSSAGKSVAVIGGGITGVTTAYALAKRGFTVTLFEKHRYAAMETSFANGGQLSASNAEVPGTIPPPSVKGLKWMLKQRCAPAGQPPKPSWHKLSLVCRVHRQHSALPKRNTVETRPPGHRRARAPVRLGSRPRAVRL